MSSRAAVARSYTALIGLAVAAAGIDQTSKALVIRNLRGRPPIAELGGLFQLNYTRNTGAAFSILPSGGWIFTVVAIAVVVAVLLFYGRLQHRGRLITAGLGLVLGGAIGNVIDRLRFGYVVDFIDFGWFPVFNLADSAIVCGVGFLILASLLAGERGT